MVLIFHLVGLKNSLNTQEVCLRLLKSVVHGASTVGNLFYPLATNAAPTHNFFTSVFLEHGTNSSFFQEPVCLLLSCWYKKNYPRGSIMKKELYFTSYFLLTIHPSWQLKHDIRRVKWLFPVSVVRKQKRINVGNQLAFSFSFSPGLQL